MNHDYIEKKFMKLVNLSISIYHLEKAIKESKGTGNLFINYLRLLVFVALLVCRFERMVLIWRLAKKNIYFPYYENYY